jgi:SAM-dependent methyltransferase
LANHPKAIEPMTPHFSEAEFHDRWAESVQLDKVYVDETFLSPASPENRFILKELGDLNGLALLELGTGQGEGATFFAKQGARACATDLSAGMVNLAQRVGAYHHVVLDGAVADAEHLGFRDESFDVVYGANTLHHADLAACLSETHRVLKPGGRAAFWDPLRYNPLINAYRRMAHQVRTEGEHPLGRSDIAQMRAMFSKVKVGHLQLATLGIFLKFYFVDMIHPNEERYWKKIVRDYDSFRGFHGVLRGLDRVMLSAPGVRWLAWNIAVVLTK